MGGYEAPRVSHLGDLNSPGPYKLGGGGLTYEKLQLYTASMLRMYQMVISAST